MHLFFIFDIIGHEKRREIQLVFYPHIKAGFLFFMEARRGQDSLYNNHESLGFRDKCGVLGIMKENALYFIRQGLPALQHRGQESAGIAAFLNNELISHTGMGLVPSVITPDIVEGMIDSNTAIGHVRYGTNDKSIPQNAQPIHMQYENYALCNATNGNLTNVEWLHNNTSLRSSAPSDTGYQTAFLLEQRTQYSSWTETLIRSLPYLKGAFSNVTLTEDGVLFAFTDPNKQRPLCLGRFNDGGWAVASESVAFDTMGAGFIREIKQGEIVQIRPDGEISFHNYGDPQSRKGCLLEKIYFSRPDSFQDGLRLRQGRERSGELLGERMMQKGLPIETVVPIFDSGYPAAKGAARSMQKPLTDAITTSHYVGRTFIQPGQSVRMAAINGKHNIVPDEINDLHIADIDDSMVRSNTQRKLVAGLKKSARSVHSGNASPPFVEACQFGVDMPDKTQLPASQWANKPLEVIEEHMAKHIGADSVTYLPVEKTAEAFGGDPSDFCHYCMGGSHPLYEQHSFPLKERLIQGKPKLAIFSSGEGTNLQRIIDEVKSGSVDGEITSVISNRRQSPSLQRAVQSGLPAYLFSSKGKLREPLLRAEYEQEVLNFLIQNTPDMIVLSGWMVVFGDQFLQTVQQLEIPIINVHPALLPSKQVDKIRTSCGTIPVLRGMHAVDEAYEIGLPVSGVTVHQILPGNNFDVGPVILKEEVRREGKETLEEWRNKIHEAEYRILPTAINRVGHVMKHGIDVSRGDFPW